MSGGVVRTVSLEGVGCAATMCSRVAVRDTNANRVWLDGLASVSRISQHGVWGPVSAVFKFKSGHAREESVIPGNRVLYIEDGSGRREKLDLASIAEISFIQ
jgi:hypothetical protein